MKRNKNKDDENDPCFLSANVPPRGGASVPIIAVEIKKKEKVGRNDPPDECSMSGQIFFEKMRVGPLITVEDSKVVSEVTVSSGETKQLLFKCTVKN